ncbi:hypothetical protein EYC80_001301 [Monilinia laxa]|uniref:Uncharacterized protein n=1 Tax=Monilinia laxa TaxID=61186 RepID=A0A5N6K8V7_MONLA|nr:hypothetical protein EYC80_001301 [Monilinia laxa]
MSIDIGEDFAMAVFHAASRPRKKANLPRPCIAASKADRNSTESKGVFTHCDFTDSPKRNLVEMARNWEEGGYWLRLLCYAQCVWMRERSEDARFEHGQMRERGKGRWNYQILNQKLQIYRFPILGHPRPKPLDMFLQGPEIRNLAPRNCGTDQGSRASRDLSIRREDALGHKRASFSRGLHLYLARVVGGVREDFLEVLGLAGVDCGGASGVGLVGFAVGVGFCGVALLGNQVEAEEGVFVGSISTKTKLYIIQGRVSKSGTWPLLTDGPVIQHPASPAHHIHYPSNRGIKTTKNMIQHKHQE